MTDFALFLNCHPIQSAGHPEKVINLRVLVVYILLSPRS